MLLLLIPVKPAVLILRPLFRTSASSCSSLLRPCCLVKSNVPILLKTLLPYSSPVTTNLLVDYTFSPGTLNSSKNTALFSPPLRIRLQRVARDGNLKHIHLAPY